VYYGDSTVGVSVNLATGRGYLGSAEGDELISIENVFGSLHNDTIIGNDANNEIYGLTGNDVLKGGGGADGLAGDDGDDILKGGGGADYLEGGYGDDTASYEESPTGVGVSLINNNALYGDAHETRSPPSRISPAPTMRINCGATTAATCCVAWPGTTISRAMAGTTRSTEVPASIRWTLTAGADVEMLRTRR
jgi:hypothetical protein